MCQAGLRCLLGRGTRQDSPDGCNEVRAATPRGAHAWLATHLSRTLADACLSCCPSGFWRVDLPTWPRRILLNGPARMTDTVHNLLCGTFTDVQQVLLDALLSGLFIAVLAVAASGALFPPCKATLAVVSGVSPDVTRPVTLRLLGSSRAGYDPRSWSRMR